MLQKILDAMEVANFKAAVKNDRLACPECGAKPISQPSSGDEVIACARCGTTASAREWCAPAGMRVGNADEPPAGTRITRGIDSIGAVVWTVPASGKSGGMMPFGIFWCAFTALFTSFWLFAPMEQKSSESLWFLFVFLGVFWAIGLAMLYAGCRSKYARHRLSVDGDSVTLHRELFGKITKASLPKEAVESVAQVEFYQRNYQPVHGIEIRAGKKKLRLGSMLTEEEKAWLVADLKRVVLGEDPHAVVAAPDKAAPARQAYFSIPVPKSEVTQYMVGVLLTIMGIALLVGLCFAANSAKESFERHAKEPVSLFSSIFDSVLHGQLVIGLIVSLVLLGSGLWLGIHGNRKRKQQVSLEGTESEVALRVTESGRVVESRVFPRSEVADIRAPISGRANGRPMKRLELIVSGKAEPLARWVDGEKADAFVAEVRRALF